MQPSLTVTTQFDVIATSIPNDLVANNNLPLLSTRFESLEPNSILLNMTEDDIMLDYVITGLGAMNEKSFYTPYAVGNFLCKGHNVFKHGMKITMFKIIKFLIRKCAVPARVTKIYKLCVQVSTGLVDVDTSWTDLSKNGRKPYLSSKQLQKLIASIKYDTKGGAGMSCEELKKRIRNHIVSCWSLKKNRFKLPSSIPNHTLNCYASIIRAQYIFLQSDSVINKSESRVIAEWSLRSTLSYVMTVSCNHFFPGIERTPYHPKKKDLHKKSQELWNLVETMYNKMIGNPEIPIKMLPVLPNMLTTTDEVTIFAHSSRVFGKDQYYIVARPDDLKNEICNSGSRNNYKKTPSGDAHLRGVRIVINSTFTAGGLSAPIFITCFGLSQEEIPGDDIITITVPGLSIGSQQDVYSQGKGFITFVRGGSSNEASNGRTSELDEARDNNEYLSKESRVAEIYRKRVYHPFIHQVRKTRYGFDGDDSNIPDHLHAVSWMDGCNSQLRLITSDENMEIEKKLKITCCKHSAARTAIEQAADCGPMFKILKKKVNTTHCPTAGNSCVYHYINQALKAMEPKTVAANNPESTKILNLLTHKRKAILATASKMPIAASRAYRDDNIKKAFELNGQIDPDEQIVPSLKNLFETYRGDLVDTCLKDNKEEYMCKIYEEAYTQGIVSEPSFTRLNIPFDLNSSGDVVDRDVDVKQENRQRSKTLTSPFQIQARRDQVFNKKMLIFKGQEKLYKVEEEEHRLNRICERKLVRAYIESTRTNQDENSNADPTPLTDADELLPPFNQVASNITYDNAGKNANKILKDVLRAFVRVRSKMVTKGSRITYHDVPTRKDALIHKAFAISHKEPNLRLYPNYPLLPIQS